MLIRILFSISTIFGLLWGNLVSDQAFKTPQPTNSDDFTVEFYPVAPFYVGDTISARVTYHGDVDLKDVPISIALASNPGKSIAEVTFSYNQQAIFFWFLNASDNQKGYLGFLFTVPGIGISFLAGINLLPAKQGLEHTWQSAMTSCCTIYYISDSDATRDIDQVTAILEEETASAFRQFFPDNPNQTFPLEDRLTLTLVPQVVGQGGFATDEAVMTYSNRNWMGIEFPTLAHHEIVHALDRYLNGDGPRPSLLSEGLAVYLSGGHYRQSPLLEQAASLLFLDRYIPIIEIVNNFYDAQHETGYMEAGALVTYMVNRWGWDNYLDFYFNL
jgi:hypothetical protein